MEIKAKVKNLKMSARKVRLVADLIRKMSVEKALNQLKFTQKKAALPVFKLIKTALADAEHNFNLDKNNLKIKEIKVDEGITMKRWMPRAFGRATEIRKRSCQISLTLSEIVDSGKKEARKVKAEDPVKLDDIGKKADKSSDKIDKKAPKKAEKNDIQEKVKDKSVGSGFAEKVFRRKSG
jgi:large subunit ribosomal protein L22